MLINSLPYSTKLKKDPLVRYFGQYFESRFELINENNKAIITYPLNKPNNPPSDKSTNPDKSDLQTAILDGNPGRILKEYSLQS